MPLAFEGHPVALASGDDVGMSLRLPELAASAAGIVAQGLDGRTLEILRSSVIPQRIADQWPDNPLTSPRSVLPLGDGTQALVLD